MDRFGISYIFAQTLGLCELIPYIPLLLGLGRLSWAQEAAATAALSKVNRSFFIENKGQWHPDVLYLYRGPGMDAWVTRYGLNLTFIKIEKPTLPLAPHLPLHERDRLEREHTLLLGHRVLLELEEANPQPLTEGLDKKPGYYNYLIGNDPSKHATNVGLYGEVQVKEVYPGIALRYYLAEGRLRYDYLVAPGADPSQIRFRLRGADKVEVQGQKLVFATRFGAVELCELRAYQGRRTVPAQFVAEGGSYRIAVGPYDRTQPLVIDPLVYSTYIGGSSYHSADEGRGIAVDGSGHVYVTGWTANADYDVTPGAFQTTYGGNIDVFVTKLNPEGSGLVYSTYLGGSGEDVAYGIAVDGGGHAYVTGQTWSSNYDVTPGAFQTRYGEGDDVVVTKLNRAG
ncbi:MAG: SBBP repeat-containing protein, partial [Bacteroidia bacterium]